MLEFMRENASSWIVKALFAIIVLVFVFWGVGGMQDSGQPVLATINDAQILHKDFFQAYEREINFLRRNNPDLSSQELEQMDFKRQVLERMINNHLLQQKAKEWGLFVTPEEVRQTISNMEIFQDAAQNFDPQRYRAVLQSSQLSPSMFEAELSGDLQSEKLQETLLSHFQASDALARDFFQYLRAKAKMQYLHLQWEDYLQEVSLTQEEIEDYYAQNQKRFEQAPQMRMNYILLTPKALASYQEVDQEEVQTYYQQNKDLFQHQERVKASHILLQLSPDAPQEEEAKAWEKMRSLQEKLQEGAEFSELAMAFSEGPSAAQGGDLGWFSRGSMVQEFEKAAFDLQPGEISDIVRTDFGLHLILVQDREEAGSLELHEVQEEIEQRLARDKAANVLEDFLDQALILLMDTGSLQETARQLDLEVHTSDFFTRDKGPADLALNQQQISKLFALEPEEPTSTPVMLDNGYLLAQKIEDQPRQVLPLKEVRPEIENTLRRKKAKAKAEDRAWNILDQLRQGKSEKYLDQLKISPEFTRQGHIPELGQNRDLARDMFRVQPGEWLSKPFEFPSGYVLAKLQQVNLPEDQEWESSRSYLLSSLNQSKRQLFFQAFLNDLRNQAKIQIRSPELLDY